VDMIFGPDEYDDHWDRVEPIDDEGTVFLHYDMEGQPCSLRTWVTLHAERFLADERPFPGVRVMTIYEGIDSDLRTKLPKIFETAVFVEDDDPLELWEWRPVETHRWATKTEALDGQRRIMASLRSLDAIPPRHLS